MISPKIKRHLVGLFWGIMQGLVFYGVFEIFPRLIGSERMPIQGANGRSIFMIYLLLGIMWHDLHGAIGDR